MNKLRTLLITTALLASGLAPLPATGDANEAPNNPDLFAGISVCGTHACAILADGSLKCWGGNGSGQLGLGDTATRGDGPGEMGANLPAVDLGTGRRAIAVAVGGFTNGEPHTCAILDDHSVKCWGSNLSGQLGIGDFAQHGDQPGEMGDNLPAVDLGTGRTAVAISITHRKTCAILDDGSIKCWGNFLGGSGPRGGIGNDPNEMGDNLAPVPLGVGRKALAISLGRNHTCAILDDHSVKCWGLNNVGQLAQGDTTDRSASDDLPAVNLGSGRTAVALALGHLIGASSEGQSCVLLDNGTVKCWGSNASGQLGQGDVNRRGDGPGETGDDLPPIDLGSGRTAVSITTSGMVTCALLDDGSVKCWGQGGAALGQGDTTSRGDNPGEMGDALPAIDLGTGRKAIALTMSETSAMVCARLDNYEIKCWGGNSNGRLGIGDSTNVARGDNPGEMGDNLPYLDLGPGAVPTATPTHTPTEIPTDTPTEILTDTPTTIPTNTPTEVPTDTPTAIPTDTPTERPTGTPTETPTATPTQIPTNTPTETPVATHTATPRTTPTAEEGSIEVERVALSRGRDTSPRDNGKVSLRMVVDDSANSGTDNFTARVLAQGLSVSVRDGDASFDVGFTAAHCSGGAAVRCASNGGVRVRVTIRPEPGQTGVFDLRVSAYGFPNSSTGPTGASSLEAPVTVRLSGAAIDAEGRIDRCRPVGTQRLNCEE